VVDVVRGQQFRQLGLDRLELPQPGDVGELHRLDRTVLALAQDHDVDHADRSRVNQREQLLRHLAREVARTSRELDHQVVNGTELIQGRCRLPCRFR
jgi:hypothetical protein